MPLFELNQTYANRKGNYTVFHLDGDKMKVRYEDGSEADLKCSIQERIWENIKAERESSAAAEQRRRASANTNFYIKAVGAITDENLTPTMIRALCTPTSKTKAPEIKIGDRFIYYSIKSRSFFAVTTITGDAREVSTNDLTELVYDEPTVNVYPIDIDAFAVNHQQAVWLDGVELESQPDFKTMLKYPETYLPINEDDFELLAEALTEFVEDNAELEDELQEEEEEEDDDDEDLDDDDDLVL